MEASVSDELQMFLAVKAVCDGKPSVWQRSNEFTEAFTDFCSCIERIERMRAATDIFHSMARGIAMEMAVAETILVTDMDELFEQFEPVDGTFIGDYTAARSMESVEINCPGHRCEEASTTASNEERN